MKKGVDKSAVLVETSSHANDKTRYYDLFRKPLGDTVLILHVGRLAFTDSSRGFLLGRLFYDTADEISDCKDYPLTEASLIDTVNTTAIGATQEANTSPYKGVQAGFESSKGCKRCDDDEDRTQNTDSAKGIVQYIASTLVSWNRNRAKQSERGYSLNLNMIAVYC